MHQTYASNNFIALIIFNIHNNYTNNKTNNTDYYIFIYIFIFILYFYKNWNFEKF